MQNNIILGADPCDLSCNAPGVCVLTDSTPACRCPDGYAVDSNDALSCAGSYIKQ